VLKMRVIAIRNIARIRACSAEEAERRLLSWQANNPQPDDAERALGRDQHQATAQDAFHHAKLLRANYGVHPGYMQRITVRHLTVRHRESSDNPNREVAPWDE